MPLPSFDSPTLYVVLIVFGATLIRSTFGFGEALIAVPLLALRIPVAIATPLAVLISVVVAGVVVLFEWKRIDFRSAGSLVIASLFGIPLGLLLLATASDPVIKLLLGVLIISFSVYSLKSGTRHLEEDHPGWMLACGFFSGILGGAYGMNGPPLVAYGAMRRWSPQQFRATLQGYFLPASLVGVIGYRFLGFWTSAVTHYFLWSLPGVVLATLLGGILNRRIQSASFFRLVYGLLVLIGAILILQAVRA